MFVCLFSCFVVFILINLNKSIKQSIAVIAAVLPGFWCACKTIEELDQCAYEISFLANRDIKVPTNDGEVIGMCE